MLAQWTGEVVGKMHIHGATAKELARHLGYHEKYVSAVLNGKRSPEGAEAGFKAALDELIASRNQPSTNDVR